VSPKNTITIPKTFRYVPMIFGPEDNRPENLFIHIPPDTL
jgi:hypothetical protein